MTIDVVRSPWKFTAASDAHNLPDGQGNFTRFRVDTIVLTSGGTGGLVTVLDESGGRDLASVVLAVNDREQIVINDYIKGIFISVLPATCIVYVHLSPGMSG